MTAVLAPVFKQRFFNANGVPLAGGKLYTYQAGSAGAVNLPTYKSSVIDPTNKNTNPIVLDANGECDIWLDQFSYLVKLTDASDVVQWTVDNIGSYSLGNSFNTPADVAAISLLPSIQVISTSGYYAPGDGGGATYKRVAVAPAHPGYIQDASGAYFVLTVRSLDAKMLGAKGDGHTDDTTPLNNLGIVGAGINAKETVISPSGNNYMISNTINMVAKQILRCWGASIQAMAIKSGFLLTRANHINQPDDALLEGATFVDALGVWDSLDGANYHTIILQTGARGVVTKNKLLFTAFTAANNVLGVMAAGVNAQYNEITSNFMTGVCLQYATGGAKYTTAKQNTIVNSPINGMGANTVVADTNDSMGHQVVGNLIINPARMGIEDFTAGGAPSFFMRGSRIERNIIIGGATAPLYFAISAVSVGPEVIGNYILNWKNVMCLEIMSGYGAQVLGNRFEWTDGNPNKVEGVQVQINALDKGQIPVVTGNTFVNCNFAIQRRSNPVVFNDNVIIDPITGVFTSDAVAGGTINKSICIGNTVKVTIPNVGARTLFVNTGNDTIIGNKVFYTAAASGGTGAENVFLVQGSNTILAMNTVDNPSDITGGGNPVNVFQSSGAAPDGCRIFLNSCTGTTGKGSIQFMTNCYCEMNQIPGNITSIGNAVYGVRGAAPIAKPTVTGSRGGNAALASLITQLALQGHVLDGTTA